MTCELYYEIIKIKSKLEMNPHNLLCTYVIVWFYDYTLFALPRI